jgi:Flp pilus assembly pilin Flp
MRKSFLRFLHAFLYDDQGQAVVEYILMISMALSVVTIIGVGFRKSLFKLWTLFAQEISAACPGCPPNPNVRLH